MQWLSDMWVKEGAGIAKDAPQPTGLALFFDILKREWWEMVKLNLLFIIASLPLITIPAATVAMARVSRSIAADENVYLLRDFLDALKTHAIRATALCVLCFSVTGAAVYTAISYASAAREQLIYSVPLAVSIVVTLFLLIVSAYAVVLLGEQKADVVNSLKRAALLALARPLPMVGALSFVALLWLAHILFYPVSVFMPATINFSLGMFALCFAARTAR
ncbi:YesL family protein [uncultured Agrobacterium sp.]|uniref:YesL family protein n=1 Tax=uncultured Agrobacterium sp. TaxID=157277 RepID=UPI002588FC65|nr:YesL family protein [uncultured Agrobacterium sp.]